VELNDRAVKGQRKDNHLANELYYRLLLHSSRVLGASSCCLRKSISTSPWLKPGADGILP
jgi:hypothetical protein